MEWKIPLTDPVTKVLQSKRLTMGAVTAEFEHQFAEKMQVKDRQSKQTE